MVYDTSVRYTGSHTGYPDATARMQLDTYVRLPWENGPSGTPLVILEFHKSAKSATASTDEQLAPLPQCPRSLLRTVLKSANDAGFSALAGLEFEWFNFSETAHSLHEKRFLDPQPITPGMWHWCVSQVPLCLWLMRCTALLHQECMATRFCERHKTASFCMLWSRMPGVMRL
jgi:glutamine synthetase